MNEQRFRAALASSAPWLDAHLQDVDDGRNVLLGQFIARWKIIAAVFILSLIIGLYSVINIPKQYMATAVLVLDPRRNQIIEGLSPLATVQWDTVAASTEVSMLQLPELATSVVRHLRLTSRAEYHPKESGGVSVLLRQLTDFIRGSERDTDNDPALLERQQHEHIATQLTRNLQVVNEPRTYAIRVSYRWSDPVHAAEVANAFAELHIAAQRDARMQSIREASAWLNREIGALQERVSNAEAAELAYRKQHGLGDDRVASTAQQEVNALALQVTLASAERAQTEAKLQEATAGILTSLEEAARVASEREANLRRQLKNVQKRLDEVLAAEAGLRALARESSASRMLLEDLLRRARTADSQLEAPRPEARIASRAVAPTVQSGLGLTRLIPGVIVGAAGLALAFGLLLIKLQAGFRSLEEAERRLGLEGIAEVPKIRRSARGIRQLIAEYPSCQIAEAMRSICGRFTGAHGSCAVILVTSPAPGDGKTMLATALAQTFATSNRRCLFIDADLRRPSAHRMLGVSSQTGFGQVLAGAVPLENALAKVLPGPLTFLSAGEVVRDPVELLSPVRLSALIDAARKRYDVIIFDSPPILPVVDASLIATHADHVILALRWASTTRAAAARAITLLKRQGVASPLLVLTRVDQANTSKYEDGRYGMDLSYAGRHWANREQPSVGA